MKEWGVLSEDVGYVDGKLIPDTGELVFDPEHAKYQMHTPYCAAFSGAPDENIVLSDDVCVQSKNERISLTLIPVVAAGSLAAGERAFGSAVTLAEAEEFVLTAMGTTGMDETVSGPGPEAMGMPMTAVEFKGKLYAETLEGKISVRAKEAVLRILNPVGEVLAEWNGEKCGEDVCFALNGEVPGVQYHLQIKR